VAVAGNPHPPDDLLEPFRVFVEANALCHLPFQLLALGGKEAKLLEGDELALEGAGPHREVEQQEDHEQDPEEVKGA